MGKAVWSAPADVATNPTIFLRLRQADPVGRELAWSDFVDRYAWRIAAFARRLGVREQDVDDVVQEVVLGFFVKSPTFVYDPAKGRFRGYLKVCAYHAIARHLERQNRSQGTPLEQVNPDDLAVEAIWQDVWEQQLLRIALTQVREASGETRTFRAFELHVMLDRPAAEVAETLGMHINSVYRAKDEVTAALRRRLAALDDGD